MPHALVLAVLVAGPQYDRNGTGGGMDYPPDSVPGTLNFDFYPGDPSRPPSVVRLDQALRLGSLGATPVAPSWQYNANDAATSIWAAWVYGDTLSLAGSGSSPTLGEDDPLLGEADGAILFNAGKAYQAAASSTGQVTTEDLLVRLLVQFSGSAGVIVEKRTSGGSGAGYTVDATTTAVRLIISDGTNSATIATDTLIATAWYYLEAYVDKSGFAQWKVNGLANGTAVSVSSVASLTNIGKLTIGADSSLANGYNGRIAYAALFASSSWLPDYQQAANAAISFAKLTATYARALGDGFPFAAQHGAAYMRKYDGSTATTLFYVGEGWPRVEKNAVLSGYASNGYVTNLFLQSQAAGTTWTKLDAGDTISSNSAVAPDGTTTADGLIPDSSNNAHGLSQSITIPDDQDFTFSGYFKAGSHSWIRFMNTTIPRNVYLNLTACALCTADGIAECPGVRGTANHLNAFGYGVNMGNGWCRLEMQNDTAPGAHTFQWEIADADNDDTTSGNGSTVAVYVWGMMAAPDSDRAPDYVPTTTATVTRNGDYLQYNATDNVRPAGFSMVCSVLDIFANDSHTLDHVVMSVSSGSSTENSASAEYSSLRIGEGNTFEGRTDVAGVSQAHVHYSLPNGPLTDPPLGSDGWTQTSTRMTGAYNATANSFKVYSNGVLGGETDSSGSMPTTPTSIWVGGHQTGSSNAAYWWAGITERCRLFNVIGRIQ